MSDEPRDAGLESFLHLLEPKLDLPKAAVEPQGIRLRLDRGERWESALRITNQGRGFLSGAIELTEKVPGFELSAGRFGLDSKKGGTGRDVSVSMQLDTEKLEAGKEYSTSLEIHTNGQPEKLVVPVSILAVDRKKRVSNVTGWILRYGVLPLLLYWLILLDQVVIKYGIQPGSLFRGPNDLLTITTFVDGFKTNAVSLMLILGILTTACLAPALLLSGRQPGCFSWTLSAGSLGFFLLMHFMGGKDPALIFGTIVLMTLIPLFISMKIIRFLYYRFPYLPKILALAITAALFTLSFAGLQLGVPETSDIWETLWKRISD